MSTDPTDRMPALFAAKAKVDALTERLGLGGTVSDRVAQVTLKNALTSYSDIAESELYSWPLSSFAPAVLEKFDLPDCYRALESKKLKQIDPLGATGKVG